MLTSQEIANTLLNFSLGAFYDGDTSFFGEVEDKLADTDFQGLAINAPRAVQVNMYNKLPVILAVQRKSLRIWEVPLKENTVLVGANLDTAQAFFNTALWDPRDQFRDRPARLKREPKPTGSDAEGISTELFWIDARARLGLPWKPGKYALGIIYYDWVSNVIEVELQGKSKPQSVQAKEVFPPIKGSLSGNEITAGSKRPFPFYEVTARTPAAPERGVNFVVDSKPGDGVKLGVFGAFATVAKPQYIPERSMIHQLPGGLKRNVAAVVPMTFAIFSLNWKTPLSWNWAFPVYSDQNLREDSPLRGYFSVDAMAQEDSPLPPGNYIAYMIMEGKIWGPVRFEIKA
jgi:hypothetical protein